MKPLIIDMLVLVSLAIPTVTGDRGAMRDILLLVLGANLLVTIVDVTKLAVERGWL